MSKKFICTVCGYVHEGDKAPEVCPKCKKSGVFKEVNPLKGTKTEANLMEQVHLLRFQGKEGRLCTDSSPL